MAGLKKLSYNELLGLSIIVEKNISAKNTLNSLYGYSYDASKFRHGLSDYILKNRNMAEFSSVAPMFVAIFAHCAAEGGILKQYAEKVSNKILSGGETIWDMLVECKGKELKERLKADANFKNMLKTLFYDKDLEKLQKNLLHLIGKIEPMSVPDPDYYSKVLKDAIKHMTGKEIKAVWPKSIVSAASSAPKSTKSKPASPIDDAAEKLELEQIRKIYKQLYDELTFDQETGNELKNNDFPTIKEMYHNDVEVTKSRKKGVCRQFAHRFVYELTRKGLWCRTIFMPGDTTHIANLYKTSRGQYFVADLGLDLQKNAGGVLPSMGLCNLTVETYVDVMEAPIYYVCDDHPAEANYALSELVKHCSTITKYMSPTK